MRRCIVRVMSIVGVAIVMAASTGLPVAAESAGVRSGRSTPLLPPGNSALAMQAFALTVDCLPGSCVAGGGYLTKAGRFEPMIATLAHSRWQRAAEVRLPSASAVLIAHVTSVDCTGFGSCVAVGVDQDKRTARGFVLAESDGRWRRTRAIVPPAESAAGPRSELDAVDCAARGFCTAAGEYRNRAGHVLPMVVTQSRGRWGRARQLPLPANAAASPDAAILAVSCTRPGGCVLGGRYTARSGIDSMMVIAGPPGRWRAIQLTLPRAAGADPTPVIRSVSCTGSGACLAVGQYDRSGNLASFSVSESRHRWRTPVVVSVKPADAARTPPWLWSVTCSKPASCLAVGGYDTKTGGSGMMVATEADGKWTGAEQIALPAGAPSGRQVFAQADAISCTATGYCAIVGDYTTGLTLHPVAATSRSITATAWHWGTKFSRQ